MKTWRFLIDVAKCWDCNNCTITCKDEHDGNDWPGYTQAQPRHGHRWMDVVRTERGQYPLVDVAYRPTPCMQCADAPSRTVISRFVVACAELQRRTTNSREKRKRRRG